MMEFTDRYQALGIPHPDPNTMCKGPCEGIGVYPEPRYRNKDGTIPMEAEWDFVTCKDCNGTGKRITASA